MTAPHASPTLHALPGMGADHRMYPAEWDRLRGIQRRDWIRHAGETSITQVAQSMIRQYGIKDGDSLIGCSLGGMVSCEIARLLNIEKLVLVGSAVHPREVNTVLRKVHGLAQYAPVDWLRFSAGKIPADAAQMFADMEASFIRAMCEAIFNWGGYSFPHYTRLWRIHGRFDLVIPPPEAPELLPNAGHLVSMTHAKDCVDFLLREVFPERA